MNVETRDWRTEKYINLHLTRLSKANSQLVLKNYKIELA